MSSSPRFWQKLGLVKQTKPSSDKKNRISFLASPSSVIHEKNETLRHRASSASLHVMAESQLKKPNSEEIRRRSPRKSLDSKIPSPLKKSKSNQSMISNTSQDSKRQLKLSRSTSNGSLHKKKSFSQLIQDCPEDLVERVLRLEQELEKERALTKSILGQKEAISKDLDYFCRLSDTITEERDLLQISYGQQKLENEQLKQKIQNQTLESQWKEKFKNMKQLALQEHYTLNNTLQNKEMEINQLKESLKESQNQMQILRNTMGHMLKADCDRKITDESAHIYDYSPNTFSDRSLSTTSEDENYSLKNSLPISVLSNSPPFPVRPHRRLDEWEEMLGEMDLQLNKVKLRRPSAGDL